MSSAPGPQRPSAAVYRRRRLVVALAALFVLLLLVWGVVAGVRAVTHVGNKETTPPAAASGGTQAEGAPSGTGSDAGTDGSPASSSAAPAGANPDGTCPNSAVTVKASTDRRNYAAGQNPVLILTLRNTLSVPCTANVGTTQQEFVVTSGSDRIFSTKDCAKKPEDLDYTLTPGKDEVVRFTWKRQRSQPGCLPIKATPRAGTYTLKVSLGKRESETVQFVLQ